MRSRICSERGDAKNRWRGHARLSVVVLFAFLGVCLYAGAAPAVALVTHPFIEKFGSVEQPAFEEPAGLAVDQSTENLLVIDVGNRTVSRWHSDGTSANFSALGGNVIDGASGADETPQGEILGGGPREVQIAVDESSGPTAGDIYVTSVGNHLVDVFAGSGAYLGQLTESSAGAFGEVCGVGVDPAGAVYVGDYSNEVVHKFVPAADPVSNADNTANFSTSASGSPCTLAAGAGPSNGSFVSNTFGGSLTKYDSASGEPRYLVSENNTTVSIDPGSGAALTATGEEFAEFDVSGATEAPLLSTTAAGSEVTGVAVNAAAAHIYVARQGSPQIEVFGPTTVLPDATTRPASEITNESATVVGLVNPAGTEASYQFEYGLTANYGSQAPVPPGGVGNDSTNHLVQAQLIGLQPSTTYHYRVDGINSSGINPGKDLTFTTTGPAAAETTGSPIRTATTARLEGRVDPRGAVTDFHFEYGSQGPCGANPCASTPATAAGAGNEIKFVSAQVAGLAPGTTYHYRLVADNGNSSGPAIGADMTVTTRASDAPLSHGEFLGPPGSDRAWEQVTPPDTGGNIVSLPWAAGFADAGDRAVYDIAGGTAESTSGATASPYFSERTASGWQTRSLALPREHAPGNYWLAPAGKADLSEFVFTNGDVQRQGTTSLWRYRLGEPPAKVAEFEPGQRRFTEVSDDGSRVLVAATGALDPSHPEDPSNPEPFAHPNLYDFTAGSPRLISLLPDGTVPECGIDDDVFPYAMNLSTSFVPMRTLHWLSADGASAFFSSKADDCLSSSQLYVREIAGGVTKRVSPPPLSGPECGAAFIKSTAGAVFFWTQSRLASLDTAISGGCAEGPTEPPNGDVYRYELGSGALTCVTCVVPGASADVKIQTGSGAAAWTEVGVAENGSRVYFVSPRPLISGAAVPGIYRVDVATGGLRYVAPATLSKVGDNPERGTGMTPDGSVLIFQSAAAELDQIGGSSNGGTSQYYRYDDRDRSLICASCPRDGRPPQAQAGSGRGLVATVLSKGSPNNTALDEGGDFFFVTPTPLLTADVNTAGPSETPQVGTDIYEWRDGRLLLVTDGITSWPERPDVQGLRPEVGGVDPSGRDVFFIAPQKLTPDAIDSLVRLYDARVGGGFNYPTSLPPCPPNSCESAPSVAPALVAPGSATFSGPGNQPPPRKKHPRKKKKHDHHKKKGHGKHKTKGHHKQRGKANGKGRLVR